MARNSDSKNSPWNKGQTSKRKPVPDLPKIAPPPRLKDLIDNDQVSFKVFKPVKPVPKYGSFGTDWVFDLIRDDEIVVPKEPEINDYVYDPNRKIPAFPKTKRGSPKTKSNDLIPYSVIPEYEIVVKFRSLVLEILSGQAYAARNNLNDAKYDSSIVILSTRNDINNRVSVPIAINGQSANAINLIKLGNAPQKPIYSVYEWVLSKIAIATDNTGENPDAAIKAIETRPGTEPLPETSFTITSTSGSSTSVITCALFNSKNGIQPDQICIHAIDTELLYETSSKDDTAFWSVLLAGDIRPLCKDIIKLPRVSLRFRSGTPKSIGGGGGTFYIEAVVEPPQVAPLRVNVDIFGTVRTAAGYVIGIGGGTFAFSGTPYVNTPTDKYTIVGLDDNLYGRSITIPALSGFATFEITPLANPNQTVDTVVFPIIAEDASYQITDNSVIATIKIVPILSIKFAPGSPTELDPNAGDFVVRLEIDRIQQQDLQVRLALAGTASIGDYMYAGLDNGLIAIIPAGSLFYDFFITPIQNSLLVNETVIVDAIQSPNYILDPNLSQVVATILSRVAVSIDFAPGSPTALNFPLGGSFVYRASLSSPSTVPALLSIGFTGSYPTNSYTVTGLSGSNQITIPAGQTFADFTVTPTETTAGTSIGGTIDAFITNVLPNGDFSIANTMATAVIEAISNVLFLMLPVGADNSTIFTDSSSYSRTITTVENTKILGNKAYFDGSGDRLTIPSSPTLAMGSSNFCFELEVETTQRSSYVIILSRTNRNTPGLSWAITVTTTGKLQVTWKNFLDNEEVLTSATSINDGVLRHIAWDRNANTHRLFINGVLEATTTSSAVMSDVNAPLVIGGDDNIYSIFFGKIKVVRITAASRYTANFTPPTIYLP